VAAGGRGRLEGSYRGRSAAGRPALTRPSLVLSESVDAGAIATSALVGAASAIATSGWIAARQERGRTREASRRAGREVLQELADIEKGITLTPSSAVELITHDFRVDFARRLLSAVQDVGVLRSRLIRTHLGRLVGRYVVPMIEELPPVRESDRDRGAYALAVAAWRFRKTDEGASDEELDMDGLLLALVLAVRDQTDLSRAVGILRTVIEETRALGFWLGEWAQWRYAIRRWRNKRPREPHGGSR
jgi:hypothetical protein